MATFKYNAAFGGHHRVIVTEIPEAELIYPMILRGSGITKKQYIDSVKRRYVEMAILSKVKITEEVMTDGRQGKSSRKGAAS